MAAEGNHVVIEHLRAIRASLGKIERELADLRHLAHLQSDVTHIHLRLDGQGERLDRIGHRRAPVD